MTAADLALAAIVLAAVAAVWTYAAVELARAWRELRPDPPERVSWECLRRLHDSEVRP